MPGTILFKAVGADLVQRFPVQMMLPMPVAYRIIDGELVNVAAAIPVMGLPERN